MVESEVTTTTASRSRSPGWLRGALAIFGSGIAAVVVFANIQDPFAFGWRQLAVPAAALVVGSVWAARQATPPLSRRRFLAYLLMPAPNILLIVVILLALGVYEDSFAETYSFTLAVIALWEVPLLVTLFAMSRSQQRERAELERQRVPFGPPPLEGELAAATRNSRSQTVIREYIDDEAGEAHLEEDKVALLPHGYELVSVDEEQGRVGVLRDLAALFQLLRWSLPDAESNNDRIIATFRKRPKDSP